MDVDHLPRDISAALEDFARRNPTLLNGEDPQAFILREGLRARGYLDAAPTAFTAGAVVSFLRDVFWPDRTKWRAYETGSIPKSRLPLTLRGYDVVMGRKLPSGGWEYRSMEPHEQTKDFGIPLY